MQCIVAKYVFFYNELKDGEEKVFIIISVKDKQLEVT